MNVAGEARDSGIIQNADGKRAPESHGRTCRGGVGRHFAVDAACRFDGDVGRDAQRTVCACGRFAQIRLHIRAGNQHRKHGRDAGSAGGSGLGQHGFRKVMLRSDGDALDIRRALRLRDIRCILNRTVYFNAVHAHRDAGTDADARGGTRVVRRIAYGGEAFERGCLHRHRAAARKANGRCVVKERMGLCGGDVDRNSTADADCARRDACLSGDGGNDALIPAAAGGGNIQAGGGDVRVLNICLAFMERNAHGDAHAEADGILLGCGFRAPLELRLNFDGAGLGPCGAQNRQLIGEGILRSVEGEGIDDDRHRRILHAVRGDDFHRTGNELAARVGRDGHGDLFEAVDLGRRADRAGRRGRRGAGSGQNLGCECVCFVGKRHLNLECRRAELVADITVHAVGNDKGVVRVNRHLDARLERTAEIIELHAHGGDLLAEGDCLICQRDGDPVPDIRLGVGYFNIR